MIQLNFNIIGTPDNSVFVYDDTGRSWFLEADPANSARGIVKIPDNAMLTGGHLSRFDMNFLIPEPGSHEAADMGLPRLVVFALPVAPVSPIIVRGDAFVFADTGEFWPWKGATDFRLLQLLNVGHDIRPLLDQRQKAGANILRVLSMKANNTGWEYHPLKTDWRRNLTLLREKLTRYSFRAELTVFADTRLLEGMSRPETQLQYWHDIVEFVAGWNWPVELINEAGHSTQACDPQIFPRPTGVLASHGSGGTDEDGVRPLWDYMTYHAIRDTATARAFTNMDPYEFQRDFPTLPKVGDENAKPPQYGFNTDYAYRMGSHAAMGCGGTFHTDEGINGQLWSPQVEACAHAFYTGASR